MTGAGAPAARSLSPTLPFALLLAAIGIVLDQATKIVAEELLQRGEFVPWLGSGVGWQLVYNPGAAFGLPAPPWLFLVVTVIVVGVVVRSLPRTDSLVQATAYSLLLSGAIGNLVDRLLRPEDGFLSGEVVDFVAWGSFPRFNLADTWITVGFALLVIALWQEERRGEDDGGEDDGGEDDGGEAAVGADEPAPSTGRVTADDT